MRELLKKSELMSFLSALRALIQSIKNGEEL